MANVEALKQLKRVVEAAPDKLFDMGEFSVVKHNCQTAHCAAGWAAYDSWFRENTQIAEVFSPDGQPVPWTSRGGVIECLKNVFGLETGDVMALFAYKTDGSGERSDIDKLDVLDSIDSLIAGDTIYPYEVYQRASAAVSKSSSRPNRPGSLGRPTLPRP
jgi:hypothetical protein